MNVLEESFLETETFAKISGKDQQLRLNYSYEAAELSPRKSELCWRALQQAARYSTEIREIYNPLTISRTSQYSNNSPSVMETMSSSVMVSGIDSCITLNHSITS